MNDRIEAAIKTAEKAIESLNSGRLTEPSRRQLGDDVDHLAMAVGELLIAVRLIAAEPKRVDTITVSGNGTGIVL